MKKRKHYKRPKLARLSRWLSRLVSDFFWTDVNAKKPPYDELVLVRVKNKNKTDGIWLYDVCAWTSDDEWCKRIQTWETITHWRTIR